MRPTPTRGRRGRARREAAQARHEEGRAEIVVASDMSGGGCRASGPVLRSVRRSTSRAWTAGGRPGRRRLGAADELGDAEAAERTTTPAERSSEPAPATPPGSSGGRAALRPRLAGGSTSRAPAAHIQLASRSATSAASRRPRVLREDRPLECIAMLTRSPLRRPRARSSGQPVAAASIALSTLAPHLPRSPDPSRLRRQLPPAADRPHAASRRCATSAHGEHAVRRVPPVDSFETHNETEQQWPNHWSHRVFSTDC